MNGQPPSSVPPIQPAAPYYPPPRRSGLGCFGSCCLTTLIAGFICVAVVIGTGFYFFHQLASNNIISDSPASVVLEQPTDAQYQTAEASLNRLKTANDESREETVAFTAADLNALLARHPDFHDLEGHARVDIADSVMTVSLSAPLDALWSSGKRRWFNGIVRFTGRYQDDEFQLNILSARGGNYEVPDYILSRLNSSIGRAIIDNTDEWDRDLGVDLRRVKRMSIEGDKLVVVTKPR